MLKITALALVLASPAYAQTACKPIGEAKALSAQHGLTGAWIELTHDQLEFLRGIYAMNPATPPGIPFGDKVFLVREKDGGMVFFVDGEVACNPMGVPKPLLEMLNSIGDGTITHEGSKS